MFCKDMLRFLLVALLIPSVCIADPAKKPFWSEYEASFHCYEGMQPVVTIRWWSMDSSGSYQEYPEIWRKGMKFGHGNRFLVEKLTGVDHDGIKKKGETVVVVIDDTQTKKKLTFRTDDPLYFKSYSEDWMQKRRQKFPEKSLNPNPAIGSESKK